MNMRCLILTVVILLTTASLTATPTRADCPLDHYFIAQQDGRLYVDKVRIYQHGDSTAGYYPLTWSMIYSCWSTGEPGFSDTTDPAYGFPPEVALAGEPNVDYKIWFEIVDISPAFYLQTDDGTWLYEIGDRYNLSNLPEHHVHMNYRAYVDQNPPPDYPYYVTYRLVDDFGTYESTPPFSLVFNQPTPTVEETQPIDRGVLESLTDAQITLTFHRAITVVDNPPVAITDAATQTEDYYTGYFDYEVSPDGLTLILDQSGPALPAEVSLQLSLIEHVRDAEFSDFAAVPFTFAFDTTADLLPGDLDHDGDVDLADLAQLLGHYGDTGDVSYEDGDIDSDGDVDLADLAELLGHYGD